MANHTIIRTAALVGISADGSKFDMWHWYFPRTLETGLTIRPPIDTWAEAGFTVAKDFTGDSINLANGRDFLCDEKNDYDAVVLFNIFNGSSRFGGGPLAQSSLHSIENWRNTISAIRPKVITVLHRCDTEQENNNNNELMPAHFADLPGYVSIAYSSFALIHRHLVRAECVPTLAATAQAQSFTGKSVIQANNLMMLQRAGQAQALREQVK